MIYVTSDLHGCDPERFYALLEKAAFGQQDFLFVLGDVIDRGDHGVTLLRWMMDQTNVQLLMGNHEALFLSCLFAFQPVTEESLSQLSNRQLECFELWLRNGGGSTVEALKKLLKEEPDVFECLVDYIRDAPLYDLVEAGGQQFALVHGGLDRFSPDKTLDDYGASDILWARPTPMTRYYDHMRVIFGHTPTQFLSMASKARAYHTDTWTCIDTGAACGDFPMLLRLDDMCEFYADKA